MTCVAKRSGPSGSSPTVETAGGGHDDYGEEKG